MKKISILLTNRNQGDKLYHSMNNIVNQTYSNFEILILAAGYRNEGIAYINDLQKRYGNIFFYEKKYASLNELRKLGLEKATGDYVIFVLPEDTLNLNALSVLVEALEKENADIAVGSFQNLYYKHYLENRVYEMKNDKDFSNYQRDVFINTMLTGKLYKKCLFTEIKVKEMFLNEAILELKLLTKAKKIITTEKVLFIANEFYSSFETFQFWKNKNSFLNKCQPMLEYQEKYVNKNKNHFPIQKENDFVHLRALDYLFWELLIYVHHSQTLELLTLEMVQFFKNEFFLSYINKIPSNGLVLKKLKDEEIFANCTLYTKLLFKKLSPLQTENPQVDIIKVCYMLFIKLFYRQIDSLNLNHYLCDLREELNLNETKEAKYINNLHL